MPADVKKRLKAFVPRPAKVQVETLAKLPQAYDLPYSRWNRLVEVDRCEDSR